MRFFGSLYIGVVGSIDPRPRANVYNPFRIEKISYFYYVSGLRVMKSKKLLVEFENQREYSCRITGTKESLRLLSLDLLEKVDAMPDQKSAWVCLEGWEQFAFDSYNEGFSFWVVPDLESHIEEKANSKKKSDYLAYAIVAIILLIIIAIMIIGLVTIVSWF